MSWASVGVRGIRGALLIVTCADFGWAALASYTKVFFVGDNCDACAMHAPPCIITRVFLMSSAGWRWIRVYYGMFVGLSIGVFLGAAKNGVGVRDIKGVLTR